MRLIKINSKYIYEIESEYKLGDKVGFTPDNEKFQEQTGIVVGVVSSEFQTNYIVKYYYKIFGGYAGACLAQMNPQTEIFTSNEITGGNLKWKNIGLELRMVYLKELRVPLQNLYNLDLVIPKYT